MADAAEQQQSESAFHAGFAIGSGNQPPAQETAAEASTTADPDAQEATQPEQEPAGEPAVFAGFTESELKSLLTRAAKVDTLEEQVRKAHGKIGELNGTLQEIRRAPTQQHAAAAPASVDFAHVETDYPDVAAYVKSEVSRVQPGTPEAQPQHQPAADATRDLQEQLMDHLNEGWREKIGSQDFNLWLATQPDDVRSTFNTTEKAKELNSVISKFDAWSGGREARQSKGKQRLEQALTPTGNAGKPKTAPSEDDAFRAAFKATIAR